MVPARSRRKRTIGSSCRQSFGFLRHQPRQAIDRRRLVEQRNVRVDVHGELDVAVPGQLLGHHRGNSAHPQQRDVAVSHGVEIDHEAIGVAVGNAGGFQVEPDHLCGVLGPCSGPYRAIRGLVGQVIAESIGHVAGKRLDGFPLAFRVAGPASHRWPIRVKVETPRQQASQLAGPQPRHHGDGVENRPITPEQVTDGNHAANRCGKQSAQLPGVQGSPAMANVSLAVESLQAGQLIFADALRRHQPSRESLDRDEVVIAGRNADPTAEAILQRLDRRTRVASRPALPRGLEFFPLHQTAQLRRLDAAEGLDQFPAGELVLAYGQLRSPRIAAQAVQIFRHGVGSQIG